MDPAQLYEPPFTGIHHEGLDGAFQNSESDAIIRFATLVCFDWVSKIKPQSPLQCVLDNLNKQAGEGQIPISWLFIIQRNPKPSHDTFLGSITDFFDQTTFPNALRERACLVFVNTAGKEKPGRTDKYGTCSVVSSPNSLFTQSDCLPTFSKGGPRFRDESKLLAGCKDVVFRERGACIYSFQQINPASVVAGAGGRTFSVDNAEIFPFNGTVDPRAPEAP